MEEEQSFWQFSVDVVLPRMLEGMLLTIELTLWCSAFGILLGIISSLARLSQHRILRALSVAYVTLFRGTPLLLQILFIYFALPPAVGITLDAKPAGILALSLNAGAYLTEIFRAAIQSIDRGQTEAARALGMGYGQTMRRVIFPQAARRLIPPVMNEIAAISKDTSLVSVVALSEMLFVTQRIAAKFLRPWEVYGWAAVGYLLIVVTLTALAGRFERRLARRE